MSWGSGDGAGRACLGDSGPFDVGKSSVATRPVGPLREKDGVPDRLERQLRRFSLPTAARRTEDASRLAQSAERSRAAAALAYQARLWGSAHSWAARRQWDWGADAIDKQALLEEEVAATL